MYSKSSHSHLLLVDDRFINQIQSFLMSSYTVQNIDEILQNINSSDIIQQHHGIIGLRKILSQHNRPVQLVINSGLVPKIFSYIHCNEYPQLQLEATWALTNIAAGTSDHCKHITENGAITLFVSLLESPYLGIIEQAVWALGNISCDDTKYRDEIIELGGVNKLISVIENNIKLESIVEASVWTLSNLCRGNPLPKYQKVKNAVQLFCQLIVNDIIKDQQIVKEACWAIAYHTQDLQGKILASGVKGLIAKVLSLIPINKIYGLPMSCLKILKHMSTLSEKQINQIVNSSGLNILYEALNSSNSLVRRETCQVIYNIAAGNAYHVQQIITNHSLITRILILFDQGLNKEKIQICHIFSNLVRSGQKYQLLSFFKSYSILTYYQKLLKQDNTQLISAALECLFIILKVGEGLLNFGENPLVSELLKITDDLKNISNSNDQDIQEKAKKLLETYFKDKETDSLSCTFDQKLKIIEQ